MRTCVVCSGKADKKDMLRMVVIDGKLVFDLMQKIEKRGYYVCYNRKCIDKISSKRKRFKENFVFDVSENLERLKKFFLLKILKFINLTNIKDNIVIGVKDIIENASLLSLVVISSDISDSSLKKIKKIKDKVNFCYLDADKYLLGNSVKKSYVVAVGIKEIKDLNFKRVFSQYNMLFSQEY